MNGISVVMSTVHLAFSPDPAYVRTARLVAASVARRAGVSGEVLDEVRLATGEACSRAVALHNRYGLRAPIDVAMSDGGRFVVRVTDRGPAWRALADPGDATLDVMTKVSSVASGRIMDDDGALTLGVGIALLMRLVSDLDVVATADGTGTEVRMSWPVNRR